MTGQEYVDRFNSEWARLEHPALEGAVFTQAGSYLVRELAGFDEMPPPDAQYYEPQANDIVITPDTYGTWWWLREAPEPETVAAYFTEWLERYREGTADEDRWHKELACWLEQARPLEFAKPRTYKPLGRLLVRIMWSCEHEDDFDTAEERVRVRARLALLPFEEER